MTDFQTIELNKDARGVATLWLNRADKNNAFDARVIGELNAALAEVQDDAGIRFLILRGRGKHFSAGADLGWMRESAKLDYQANLADAHELGEVMQRLYKLPQPTLAVVQGAAFGGALGLIAERVGQINEMNLVIASAAEEQAQVARNISHRRLWKVSGSTLSVISSLQMTRWGAMAWPSCASVNCLRVMLGSTTP